jgi:hypothetical protein
MLSQTIGPLTLAAAVTVLIFFPHCAFGADGSTNAAARWTMVLGAA